MERRKRYIETSSVENCISGLDDGIYIIVGPFGSFAHESEAEVHLRSQIEVSTINYNFLVGELSPAKFAELAGGQSLLQTARNDALEEAAKVADGYHEAAIKWAATYVKQFDGETDSKRIAAAIRSLKSETKP